MSFGSGTTSNSTYVGRGAPASEGAPLLCLALRLTARPNLRWCPTRLLLHCRRQTSPPQERLPSSHLCPQTLICPWPRPVSPALSPLFLSFSNRRRCSSCKLVELASNQSCPVCYQWCADAVGLKHHMAHVHSSWLASRADMQHLLKAFRRAIVLPCRY